MTSANAHKEKAKLKNILMPTKLINKILQK